jgi:hypothetical protein
MTTIKSDKFKWVSRQDKKIVTFDKLDEEIAKANVKNEMTPLPVPENWRQTDSILVKAPGYWWIHSKVDKRWRAEGKSEEVGGADWCPEAKKKYWELRGKFGMQPWDTVYKFELRNLKKFKLASETK